MKKKRFKKIWKFYSHPDDLKNLTGNIILLILISIASIFIEDKKVSDTIIYVGVGINLFYFLLCFLSMETYYEEI